MTLSHHDRADENHEQSGFDAGKSQRTKSFDTLFNGQEFSSNNSRQERQEKQTRQERQSQQTGETPPGDPSGDPRNSYGQPDDSDNNDRRQVIRHMRVDMRIVNEGRIIKLHNSHLSELELLEQIFSKFENISYKELALIYHPTIIYSIDEKTGVQEPKYFAINKMYGLLSAFRGIPHNTDVINAISIEDKLRSTDKIKVVNSLLTKITTEPEYDPVSNMYKNRAAALLRRDQENIAKLRMTIEEKELVRKERVKILQEIEERKQRISNDIQLKKQAENRIYDNKTNLKSLEEKLKDLSKLLD